MFRVTLHGGLDWAAETDRIEDAVAVAESYVASGHGNVRVHAYRTGQGWRSVWHNGRHT